MRDASNLLLLLLPKDVTQFEQVNNIVLSGNIYLEEESYPNTADNLSKDK